MPKHSAPRSASPRAQHPAEAAPAELHDDTLIGATKVARFLGLADSSFYLLRQRMGADFPKPTLIIGRPRYRVGALREWLRRMEAQNGEELTKPYREHPAEAQP